LLRDIAAGAPVVNRGGRGRGHAMLLDTSAIAAWRRRRRAARDCDALRVLAAQIPELVADGVMESFVAVEGSDKRRCAGILAAAWFVVANRVLDRIRRDVPDVPEIETVPEAIEALRKITAK
jgi:hypothetical protein